MRGCRTRATSQAKAISSLGSVNRPGFEIAHDSHVRRGPPPGVRLRHFVICHHSLTMLGGPREAGPLCAPWELLSSPDAVWLDNSASSGDLPTGKSEESRRVDSAFYASETTRPSVGAAVVVSPKQPGAEHFVF